MALTIRVLEADFIIPEEEDLARMVLDSSMQQPYCEVVVGPDTQTTRKVSITKNTAVWDQILQFERKTTRLKIVMKDDIMYRKDDVGCGWADISKAYEHPNEPTISIELTNIVPIELFSKTACTGKLIIELEYLP